VCGKWCKSAIALYVSGIRCECVTQLLINPIIQNRTRLISGVYHPNTPQYYIYVMVWNCKKADLIRMYFNYLTVCKIPVSLLPLQHANSVPISASISVLAYETDCSTNSWKMQLLWCSLKWLDLQCDCSSLSWFLKLWHLHINSKGKEQKCDNSHLEITWIPGNFKLSVSDLSKLIFFFDFPFDYQ
jgi:hypothetical protein